MNPNDDYYIADAVITARASIGFSVPAGSSPEAIEARAESIIGTMSGDELKDEIYDIVEIELIDVEQE